MPATIAIVGRPNVGKSTLFNRLIGERKALVHDRPGVTRDRNYGQVQWRGRTLHIVDTGGYEPNTNDDLLATMRTQVEVAIEEASALIFVLDRQTGLTPPDEEMARLLRTSPKPVLLAINKVDHPSHEADLAEFWALGFPRLFPVSAEHDRGTWDLLDATLELLPDEDPDAAPEGPEDGLAELRIAILGRPNIGKSTLANRLCGEERHLVHDAPGTTMDAVDSTFQVDGRDYRLVDTAGIRRRSRISDDLEGFAVSHAIRTIERCHVTLLLLDATSAPSVQDARLARLVTDRGRALILVANRWDLIREMEGRDAKAVDAEIRENLPHVPWAPVLYISALTGRGCQRIIPTVDRIFTEFDKRIPTSALNRFLQETERAHSPPQRNHHPVRIHFMAQRRVRPPTFTFFTNTPEGVPESYQRYLANRLREAFGFEGSPLKLEFKKKRKTGEPA